MPSHVDRWEPRGAKGPEVLASMRQLWRLNSLPGALHEALLLSSGEARSHVTDDAAHAILRRRKLDGEF